MRGVTLHRVSNPVFLVISTHTPHARRDVLVLLIQITNGFQLTRLMRGVTIIITV